MAEKRKVWRVTDGDGNIEQVLVETSAEQVTVADAGDYYEGTNVEAVLQEIGGKMVEGVGKVDDVVNEEGTSLVTNKIAKVTATAIGLGNVDNTADTDKPISTAQQAALNAKVDKTTTINEHALSGNVTITKSDVGLGDVDNTADSVKNVATAVKATQDGSGNVIVDTYATKTDLQSGLAGKSSTKTYDTYSDFVDAVMVMNNTALKVGDNVLIKALDVPDMWVYKVNSTKTDYTYSSDANIIAALASADGLTVGYYVFAKLETQKVDLTAYQTKTDNSLNTASKTVTGAINEHEGDISALASRVGEVESENESQGTAIQAAQNAANAAQTTANEAKTAAATNAGDIAKIVGGTTTVGKATAATTATKLDAKKTFALTGNVEGSVTSDLSSGVSIATTIADNAVTTTKIAGSAVTAAKIANGAVTKAKLEDAFTSTPDSTYTALKVDSKGRATQGGQLIEFGTSGQTTPSANLIVNGLFFQLQEQ